SRFISNSPPSSQPPGKGMAPETLNDRGKKICSGIQAKAERKYFSTAVQLPSSTCARVPDSTTINESTKRMTVSLREAIGATMSLKLHCLRGDVFGFLGGSPAAMASTI